MITFKHFLNKEQPTAQELAQKWNVSLSIVKKQVEIGIKAEMEHTTYREVAQYIALAHLKERLDYYQKLFKYVETYK